MSRVYLIPCPISEDGLQTLSQQILPAVQLCEVFFVESERSARRFLKKLWKEIHIDGLEWHEMGSESTRQAFENSIRRGKIIGIISDAGCPGIADPGQELISIAQENKITVVPLVGPSSILLALMASGMNGQKFTFHGYLPIEQSNRTKAIKDLEATVKKEGSTQIFIETPYRNNQMVESLLKNLHPHTKLCIATDVTGERESIRTMSCGEWKRTIPDLHKKTVIYLIG
jgi:16S rRNA (cytidine1402-2'-O)-methyltransferase